MSRAIGLGHRNLTVRDAAAKGRQGDALLVHVSPEEWALGAEAAGDDFSINPDTGLAEHFSFGKVLKGVAKAAAALVGGELGGPAGAAAGGLIASKALGDDWQTAISTGALSGLGAWGVQQTGAADSFGGGLSSGSDLLGREGGDANFSGIAKYAAPAIAGVIGLSGLGGSGKSQSTQAAQPSAADDYNTKPFDWQPPLDRTQYAYPGDFSTYGQTSGEHQWFDDVNPQPMSGYADGGPVDGDGYQTMSDELPMEYRSEMPMEMRDYMWPIDAAPDTDHGQAPSAHHHNKGHALGGPVRYLATGGRADRDQQGYSGGRSSSDNPGGGSSSSGGTHGASTGAYNGEGRPNAAPSPTASNGAFTGPGAGPMSGSGNATVADRGIIDKYKASPQEGIKTDRDFWSAVGNLGQRSNDYMDRGNSTLDNLGNAIAGLFSVGEMDPTKQNLNASINNPNASWGVDPIGLGATIVGTLTGLPLGSIYKGVKKVTGYPGPQIAFDGNQYGNFGFNSSPISQGLGVMSADDMAKAVASGATGSTFGGTPGGSPASLGNDTSRGETALPTGLGALVSNGGSGAGNVAPVSTGTDTGTTTDPTAAGRTYIPFTGDYSTYGQGPQHEFYDNINPPMAPVTLASGGAITGLGDGQTDTIPAMLAPGEHVVDAATVAALGNGNNAEGQRVLQAMKTKVRRKMGLKNPSRPPRKIDAMALAA